MQIPIVMAAFGTTSKAEATYKIIDSRIKEIFPEHEVHWAYSSRTIKGLIRSKKDKVIKHPHEILQQLQADGYTWAVVQSVHLTCGHEFYRLLEEIESVRIRSSVGMPLLTTPDDHFQTATCLEPLILDHPDKAILLMGHGTDHPSWTAYPAFQQTLRQIFGDRIFVGAVEHYPPSEGLIAQISNAGFKHVLLVPFLLVAGMHYQNDLMGNAPESWLSRLESAGLRVDAVAEGIGRLPCIGDIFCNHIKEALDVIPL